MHITIVKKRLANGEPCPKCVQAHQLLERRGLLHHINQEVWALEGQPESEGYQLSAKHQVENAPFFIVQDGNNTRVFTSVLVFIKEVLDVAQPAKSVGSAEDLAVIEQQITGKDPPEIVRVALSLFGAGCNIAFSGAEDVAVVDMAVRTGLPFKVFCLDTGRLHPETYRFLDRVRKHYGIEIELAFPEFVSVQNLVRSKGLYSFYDDGHTECCAIRKVEPLRRVLSTASAWMTGQRRDQSPTRTDVPVVQIDKGFNNTSGVLYKFNPVASWSLAETWNYLRERQIPTNELHNRGFISIGCEPCTRPVAPGEHERAGRWWWEESTKRECGLHVVR